MDTLEQDGQSDTDGAHAAITGGNGGERKCKPDRPRLGHVDQDIKGTQTFKIKKRNQTKTEHW